MSQELITIGAKFSKGILHFSDCEKRPAAGMIHNCSLQLCSAVAVPPAGHMLSHTCEQK